MIATPINPWDWSIKLGFSQAQLIEKKSRELICSGQTSVNENGEPMHAGDMRAQISLAIENLKTVLAAADMSLSNMVQIKVYSTDVDLTLQNMDVIGAQFGAAQVMPAMSLVGVDRLAMPELMIELEVVAAD